MTSLTTHLKPGDVASLLGVSLRTLSRWHSLRVGPPRAKVGRTVLYRSTAFEAWLSQNESQPLRSFAGGTQ
jgi:phage terminase Nu1 subunit (DNA packaging protein)